MRYIFLDTNTFLHYRMFTDIDFLSLFGDEPTNIVILEVVIKEIDDHKNNNPRKKIRSRAGEVTKKILDVFNNPNLKKNLEIKCEHFCPVNYRDMGLDDSSNDHRIIGAILTFQNTKINPLHDSILFITHDIGATLLAQLKGISIETLPEELKLAEELDEDEKELRRLQKEKAELLLMQPKLEIRVAGQENDIVKFSKSNMKGFILPDVISIDELKRRFPKEEYVDKNKIDKKHPMYPAIAITNVLGSSFEVEKSEIDRYNRDIDFGS